MFPFMNMQSYLVLALHDGYITVEKKRGDVFRAEMYRLEWENRS